jgi:hypothetical protein
MVAQNGSARISLEVAQKVAASLKVAQPGNASLGRALDKALELMEQGHHMELSGNVLHCDSATTEGVAYAAMVQECPCPTTQGVCWHRAACAVFIGMQTIEAAALVCQPLTAKPRRARTARPALAGVEVQRAAEGWRAQRGITREMSQADLERLCNWE